MANTFSWDKKTQRYRWTSGPKRGQFISATTVAGVRDTYIQQSKENIGSLVEDLLANRKNVRDFESGMAKNLKTAHSNTYLLGLGGVLRYEDAKDKGILGARLKSEYRHLRRFSRDILDGKLSEAQIRARAKQYFNGLHATYERARNEAHKRNSFLWERDLRSAGESCATCVSLENKGWVPIGENPPIGVGRECGGNCKCRKIYDSSPTKPTSSHGGESESPFEVALASSLRNAFGWTK